MELEKLEPVIQYFAELTTAGVHELEAIGRSRSQYASYEEVVDAIAEAREKLAEGRYYLAQLYSGQCTEAAAYFERKISALELARSVWDIPAAVGIVGPRSLNQQREKSAAEHAKLKLLAECLVRGT